MTEAVCRVCRKPLVRGPLGHWAHVTNPTWRHHYAKAVVLTITESENRALWGDK